MYKFRNIQADILGIVLIFGKSMKQAGSVVASFVRSALFIIFPLTFVILKQCNGSNSDAIMFEIPPDHQKRFVLTNCKKTDAEDIHCKCKSLGRDCSNNDTKNCENCRCLSDQTMQYRTFYIKKGNRALCLSTNNLLKAGKWTSCSKLQEVIHYLFARRTFVWLLLIRDLIISKL